MLTIEETEEIKQLRHGVMINRWYAIMPRGRFWHLVETNTLTVSLTNHTAIVWFERRHQRLWLTESLIGLLRFPEFPTNRRKIPHPIPKFWRVPLPGEQ